MVVITERDKKGRLIVEIIDSDLAYETMEQLVEIIGRKFEINVLDKADSIDERIWKVNISGKTFFIEYDDMVGFDIIPKGKNYDELVQAVGTYLAGTLKV